MERLSGLDASFLYLETPTMLMQVGLIMRVIGDLATQLEFRRWGGLINGVAILWFLLQVIFLAIRAKRRSSRAKVQSAIK